MKSSNEPPKKYRQFIDRFPKLEVAWEAMHDAGAAGPLDARVQRLVKLAVAIGAFKEGAVHSSARKALSSGISLEELEQVVALAASTMGMPSTVAAFTWVHDVLDKDEKKGKG